MKRPTSWHGCGTSLPPDTYQLKPTHAAWFVHSSAHAATSETVAMGMCPLELLAGAVSAVCGPSPAALL